MPQSHSNFQNTRRIAQNVSTNPPMSVKNGENKEKIGHNKEKKSTSKIVKQNKSLKTIRSSNLLTTSNKCDDIIEKSFHLNKKEGSDNLKINIQDSQMNSTSFIDKKCNPTKYSKVASNHKNKSINENLFCNNNKSLSEENRNYINNSQNVEASKVFTRSFSKNKRQESMNFKITSNKDFLATEPIKGKMRKKSKFQHNQVRRRWKRSNCTYELILNMFKSSDVNSKLTKLLPTKKAIKNGRISSNVIEANAIVSESKIEDKMKEDNRKQEDGEEQPNNLRLTKSSSFPSSETSRVKKLASFWEGKLLRIHSKSEKTLCDAPNITENEKEYNEEEVKDNEEIKDKYKFKEIISTVNKLQKLLENIPDLSEVEKAHINSDSIQSLGKNNDETYENIQVNPNNTESNDVNPYWTSNGLENNPNKIQEISKNIALIVTNASRATGVNKNELFNEILKQINLIENKSQDVENENNDTLRNTHVESKVQARTKITYNYLQFMAIIIVIITIIIIVLLILVYSVLLDWVLIINNEGIHKNYDV